MEFWWPNSKITCQKQEFLNVIHDISCWESGLIGRRLCFMRLASSQNTEPRHVTASVLLASQVPWVKLAFLLGLIRWFTFIEIKKSVVFKPSLLSPQTTQQLEDLTNITSRCPVLLVRGQEDRQVGLICLDITDSCCCPGPHSHL